MWSVSGSTTLAASRFRSTKSRASSRAWSALRTEMTSVLPSPISTVISRITFLAAAPPRDSRRARGVADRRTSAAAAAMAVGRWRGAEAGRGRRRASAGLSAAAAARALAEAARTIRAVRPVLCVRSSTATCY